MRFHADIAAAATPPPPFSQFLFGIRLLSSMAFTLRLSPSPFLRRRMIPIFAEYFHFFAAEIRQSFLRYFA
jgi:hypothetical protein